MDGFVEGIRDRSAHEADIIRSITDEFAREMDLRFAYEGKKVAMGAL